MKLNRICTLVLLLTVTAGLSKNALGRTTCQPSPQGQLCISQVDFNTFAQTAYQNQQSSQWCWAASISMLFSYYRHPVSQQSIVQSLYGRILNLPAGTGWNIASQVNRPWVDVTGKRFRAE